MKNWKLIFVVSLLVVSPDCISSMKRCKLEPIANK